MTGKSLRGKTYEEIHGFKKAKVLKEIRRLARIGFIFSQETIDKISKSQIGKPKKRKTDEEKKNFSIYAKEHNFGKWMKGRYGKQSQNFGKHWKIKNTDNMKYPKSKEFKENLKINNARYWLGKEGDSRISGKNSANWLNGKSFELYGIEFNNQFKNSIRKRDNQICINCGIHREKLKEALSIHHINYYKKCNLQQNCVSLCRKCHMLTGFNREYWQKIFQEKLYKLYNYKYSENGDIILEINNKI